MQIALVEEHLAFSKLCQSQLIFLAYFMYSNYKRKHIYTSTLWQPKKQNSQE